MKGECGLKKEGMKESRHMSISYPCCLLRVHHVSDTPLNVGKTIVRLDHILLDKDFALTEFILY